MCVWEGGVCVSLCGQCVYVRVGGGGHVRWVGWCIQACLMRPHIRCHSLDKLHLVVAGVECRPTPTGGGNCMACRDSAAMAFQASTTPFCRFKSVGSPDMR